MRFLQEVTEDWTNAHSVFHGRLNFLNVMSFFKVMQHLSSSSFSAFCFLVEKSLVFFKILPESVIGAAGVGTGAVGVDAKLIVVLDSVKLVFPRGWVISSLQCSYSYRGVNFCVSSVILFQFPSYHVGIVTLGC